MFSNSLDGSKRLLTLRNVPFYVRSFWLSRLRLVNLERTQVYKPERRFGRCWVLRQRNECASRSYEHLRKWILPFYTGYLDQNEIFVYVVVLPFEWRNP